MVSLRSGSRTTKASPAAQSELTNNDVPSQVETPKRRGRPAAPKVTKQVFEEPEAPSEEKELAPVKTPRTSRRGRSDDSITSSETVKSKRSAKGRVAKDETQLDEVKPVFEKKSDSKVADSEKSAKRASKKPVLVESDSDEKDDDQPLEVSGTDSSDDHDDEPVEVFSGKPVLMEPDSDDDHADESVDVLPEKAVLMESNSDEEDDDDEPMEVSSKTPNLVKQEADDDNDDEPMEVSSKVHQKPVEVTTSVVDKLLERKALKSAKLAAKKLKKRSKKKETKKLTDGVFQVKMKKSSAKFNVVTLKKGVQAVLEPAVNFREELLKSRTAGTRCTNTEKYLQRAQWVSKK